MGRLKSNGVDVQQEFGLLGGDPLVQPLSQPGELVTFVGSTFASFDINAAAKVVLATASKVFLVRLFVSSFVAACCSPGNVTALADGRLEERQLVSEGSSLQRLVQRIGACLDKADQQPCRQTVNGWSSVVVVAFERD